MTNLLKDKKTWSIGHCDFFR